MNSITDALAQLPRAFVNRLDRRRGVPLYDSEDRSKSPQQRAFPVIALDALGQRRNQFDRSYQMIRGFTIGAAVECILRCKFTIMNCAAIFLAGLEMHRELPGHVAQLAQERHFDALADQLMEPDTPDGADPSVQHFLVKLMRKRITR